MKNNTTKNLTKKSGNNGAIIVVIIFIFVIILAVIFGTSLKNYIVSSSNTGYLSLEPIKVTLSSKNTSNNHSIDLKFHLEGIEKDLKKIDTDTIIYIITEELKNLNYDDITEKDGMEYLKNHILEILNTKYKGITKIYIENFITDVEVGEPNSSTNTNNNLDYLKGFKWSK